MLTPDCRDGGMQDLSRIFVLSVDNECMVQVADLRNRTSIFAVGSLCRLNLSRYGGVLFAVLGADFVRFLLWTATL